MHLLLIRTNTRNWWTQKKTKRCPSGDRVRDTDNSLVRSFRYY